MKSFPEVSFVDETILRNGSFYYFDGVVVIFWLA